MKRKNNTAWFRRSYVSGKVGCSVSLKACCSTFTSIPSKFLAENIKLNFPAGVFTFDNSNLNSSNLKDWPLCHFCRFGLVHISRVGSVFMTLSVTVERFVAIVYPLQRITIGTLDSPIASGMRGGSRGSNTGAKLLIIVSTITAVVYNIPRY